VWKYSDGPTTEISARIQASATPVWALVSESSLPTRWLSEVQATWWLDGETGPSLGLGSVATITTRPPFNGLSCAPASAFVESALPERIVARIEAKHAHRLRPKAAPGWSRRLRSRHSHDVVTSFGCQSSAGWWGLGPGACRLSRRRGILSAFGPIRACSSFVRLPAARCCAARALACEASGSCRPYASRRQTSPCRASRTPWRATIRTSWGIARS
jgi:hypothetical protein